MKNNKLKLFTEILVILVIVLISFVGIYTQKENRMENQVKEYQYSKDLNGYREVLLEAIKEENSNEDGLENSEAGSENKEDNVENENNEEKNSKYSYENFINSKKIIEKRLRILGVQDYTISQNTENGEIYLQLPENEQTDYVLSNVFEVGKFEIKDSEDSSKVYLNNDSIKKVSVVSKVTDTNQTIINLKFEFNKKGRKTLSEISSGEYKTKEETEETEQTEKANAIDAEAKTEGSDENTDESETENEDKQKKITLTIDNSELITTSFDTSYEDGILLLSMNNPTNDVEAINNTLKSASTICGILKSGTMPLEYEVKQNVFIQSDISNYQLNIIYIILGIIVGIFLVALIIKYKAKGIIGAISNIGFLASLLLIIRYTNVIISLESIFTGFVVLIINYLIVRDFIKMDTHTKLLNLFKTQVIMIIPIILVAIIFSFSKVIELSSCGMFLFWGILVSMIYNYALTRDMLIRKEVNINEK